MEILLGAGTMTAGNAGVTAAPGVHVHEVSNGSEAPGHDHGPEYDIGFDTWTYTAEAPLSMAWLQQIITHLPSTVFRMKGFVHTFEEPGRRTVVQLVGRRATLTPSRSWGVDERLTRLVFISRQGTVNYPAIEQALDRSQMDSC
jgi:G3E family GTPase